MARTQRPTCMVVALLLAAISHAVAQQAPAIINHIPPDAKVFMAIPNLQAVSDKFAMLDRTLKINHPISQNLLGFIQQSMQLNNGVNTNAGAAVALLDLPFGRPDADGAGMGPGMVEPTALIIVPITDYGQFLNNFNATPQGGVQQVQWQGETFIRQAGPYAIMSNTQDAVANFQPQATSPFAKQIGALGGQVLGGSDVVAYANLEQLGPILRPLVQMGLQQMQMEMQNNPMMPDSQKQMVNWSLGMYSSIIDGVLRDGAALVYGLDLSDQGLGLSYAVQFKPDSPTGQVLAKAPARSPRFNRWPDRPYLLLASMTLDAFPLEQWLGDLTDGMPQDNPMTSLMQSSLAMMKLYGQEVQQAYYAPNIAAGPAGLFNAVTVTDTPRPAAMLQGMEQLIGQMNNMDLGEGLKYVTAYQKHVMQVDQRNIDRYSLRMQVPPEMMAQMGPAAMFFGQDWGGYLAPLDDAVVMATAADPAALKQAIDTAAAGNSPLDQDAGIAMVRRNLMDNRAMEMYLGTGTLMQLGQGLITMFAPQANIKLPADLPPIGCGLSTGNGGMAMRGYIPMAVAVGARDVVTQFMSVQPQPAQVGGDEPQLAPEAAQPGSPNVVTFTDANFQQEAMNATKPVLVDFWAVWCGPCRQQGPIVDTLADQFQGRAIIGKLDVDRNPNITNQFGLQSIPTLILLKNGQVVKKFVGLTSKDKLQAAINQALP